MMLKICWWVLSFGGIIKYSIKSSSKALGEGVSTHIYISCYKYKHPVNMVWCIYTNSVSIIKSLWSVPKNSARLFCMSVHRVLTIMWSISFFIRLVLEYQLNLREIYLRNQEPPIQSPTTSKIGGETGCFRSGLQNHEDRDTIHILLYCCQS